MLDILPSGEPSRFSGTRKTRRFSARRPSQNILKVDWRLPARLRKPIRPQLVAQRQAKRAKILSGFARRPLTTQRLLSDLSISETAGASKNMGAEYHTADIYRESVPNMRLVAPPYMGSAVKQRMHAVVTPTLPPLQKPAATPGEESSSTPGEAARIRDEAEQGVVKQPKRRLQLPFTLSIVPKGIVDETPLFSSEVPVPRRQSRLPVFKKNLAILLAGCIILSSVVWNLQNLGRGWGVLATVEDRANQAAGHLLSAGDALAESNFSQSELAFADAASLLSGARSELDEALSASRHVVSVLDVSGTVRSGDLLLSAGEALAQAGQHISRGLSALLSAQLVEGGQAEAEATLTLTAAIEKSRGEFEQALAFLASAEEDLQGVRSSLLPEEVKEAAGRLQAGVPRARAFLTQYLEQSGLLLTLLGHERQRDYLILFANNHELRPVGGFLGSIGLISVDRGVVEKIDVNTVYDGDGQLKEFIAPPEPLSAIVNRWYLRDSNWFVDFRVSAAKAAQFFEKEGGPTVDGVMLLTPTVISDLLRMSGPIEMPTYDVTVTADNFAEVTQREVTYDYDQELNRPKQFLADLTPVLLNKIMEKKGAEGLPLLSALTSSLSKKDLLLFFRDENLQKRAHELGWAGNIPQGVPGLVYVNNANIGGHKSDQFIEQELDARLHVTESGEVDVVLTIRRTHHGDTEGLNFDFPLGENPAEKDNVVFQRVLAPRGATLVEASGFTPAEDIPRTVVPESASVLSPDPDVAEWQRGQVRHASGTLVGQEAGYTFFGNWMVTRPGQTTVGLYRYRLPERLPLPGIIDQAGRLGIHVVKQPGQGRTSLRVSVRLPKSLRLSATAPDSGITRVSDVEFTYHGELSRDLVLGAVFEGM